MVILRGNLRGLREQLVLALKHGVRVPHVFQGLEVHHDVYVCASNLASDLNALKTSTLYFVLTCARYNLDTLSVSNTSSNLYVHLNAYVDEVGAVVGDSARRTSISAVCPHDPLWQCPGLSRETYGQDLQITLIFDENSAISMKIDRKSM